MADVESDVCVLSHKGANLQGAELRRASVATTTPDGVHYGWNSRDADLNGAYMRGADLSRSWEMKRQPGTTCTLAG